MSLSYWLQRITSALRLVYIVIRTTIRTFSDQEGMHLAAGIAYYALLSLFPMSLIMIGLLSYLFSPDQIVSWLVNLLGNQTSMSPDFLRETVSSSAHLWSAKGVLGIAGLVLSSTLVFAAIMRSINRAWGFKGTGTRTFVKRKLWEFASLAGVALLFFFFLAAASLIDILRRGPFPGTDFYLHTSGGFWSFLLTAVPFVVVTGILLLLYKWVPTTKVRWRDVWLPSVLVAAGLKLASNILSWYIGNLGAYKALYGSLASLIVLLLWVYVCANLLIVGAALSATLANVSREPTDKGGRKVRRNRERRQRGISDDVFRLLKTVFCVPSVR